MKKKKKLGLVPKLLMGIILGILIGYLLPAPLIRIVITFSTLFSSFLQFVIPLMILAFVTMGIADLTQGAGKLLGITACIAYASTLLAGSVAFIISINLFPHFISKDVIKSVCNPKAGMLSSYFTIKLNPILDVTAAVVLAFIMGLCISSLRGKGIGDTTYNLFDEFSKIINLVLNTAIIPLLPFYIMGTFANMTVSGQILIILSVLWKVFVVVICLHVLYLLFLFSLSGSIGKKKPFEMMRHQIPGYLAAIGTQSSAACIPVNIKCAESNGVCKQIRNFVIPLCANIHMPGSMITITCCVTSVLLMNNMKTSLSIMIPFIMTLGIAMIASPGAPGGSIMSALPFLPMVGIGTSSALASLLIALYIAQDSFGTACNVSGDNAIAVIIDTIYNRFIKKEAVSGNVHMDPKEIAK